MTTRPATAPPDRAPAAALTEVQVRGDGPVARVVAARPWLTDAGVTLLVLLLGVVTAELAWETAGGALDLGLFPAGSDVGRRVTTTWLVGALAGAALLLGRRRWPLAVTALLTVATVLALAGAGVMGVLGVCLAFALHRVASTRDAGTTWGVCAAVLVVLTVAAWRLQDIGLIEMFSWFSFRLEPGEEPVQQLDAPLFSPGRRSASVLLLLALLLLGVATGTAARARRLHALDLVARYEAMARDRDQSAALARAAERARIAREMHDVVAHNVSVMVALSDGADAAFERAPAAAREAVREVSRTGRAALSDMQRVLGALDPGGPDGDGHGGAQPTEVDLATVVARFRTAGLPVAASGLGVHLPADTSVRLALLRIVGEALTNVLRHAPGTPAVEVTVRRTPAAVEVDVVDAGGTRPGTGGGTGRGVLGMRERAALFGGHVEAGPRPDGGWRVHAVLPWPDDEEGRR